MKHDPDGTHGNPQGAMISGLVSVVVCAYNNWPDVELTIASALHQSYQPIEVIVVDNSSTDATPEEVPRRFGRSIRYIRQNNKGGGGAYNAGFAQGSGEFFQFVDGDDVLAPNKIEKQVEVFRANPEFDIVYGDFRMFQTLPGLANWEDVATKPEEDMLKALMPCEKDWVGIIALNTLFRRKVLERVGPWDENLYIEDDDYWLRAAIAGCRFGHCPESLMGFKRIRPGQMTQNASAMAHGREALWEKALGYVTGEPYRSIIAAQLARVRLHIAVSGDQMAKRDALAKLALARATSTGGVSLLDYAIGWAKIVVPGVRALARLRWLRGIRRGLSRLDHHGIPG